MSPSLALLNGRIYTQDDHKPFVSALTVRDGRIAAFGTDDEIESLLGSRGQSIDLEGRAVVPGLVDAHVHFQSFALSLDRIDLSEAASLNEALAIIEKASGPGDSEQWLLGRGWNQNLYPHEQFPSAQDLDNVSRGRPALLYHHSGHSAWVNSKGLQAAGISLETPDPPGGLIQRDRAGKPTGILFEEATKLVSNIVPRPSQREIQQAMMKAQRRCLSLGLTGVHDFDGRSCFRALQALHSERNLQLRVVKSIPMDYLDHAVGVGLRSGFGDNWLRIGGLKMFADGALGPKTASMIESYEEDPSNFGIIVTDKEEMISKAVRASTNGINVAIHAIGDRANHDVLDVFSVVRQTESEEESDFPQRNRLRHRIEHAQIVHPDDFERFADLDIIASMQPLHVLSDMDTAAANWGERTKYSYAWRRMLASGAKLAFGTDAPIEPINPILSLFAAVNRKRVEDSGSADGWHSEQKLTTAEAVKAYTMGSAYAGGQENQLGSISPGKLADLTIFSKDIYAVPPDELIDVSVDGTMIGGIFRYRNW